MLWFQNKRKQIGKSLPKNSVLILDSWPEFFRQPDVPHPYRQDSNFYYLTGWKEANSLFFLFSGKNPRSVLFIPDKNPKKELWEGPFLNPQEARRKFLISEIYPLSELKKKLPHLLKGKRKIFYDRDSLFFKESLNLKEKELSSARNFLSLFRRIKDKTEISHIKKAISITKYAHLQVAQALKPGIKERELHGIFIQSLMKKGSPREAYGGIVACGNQATTIHYNKNSEICRKGEILLLDAGAETNYYNADVTRAYPVSGKFSKNQKKLYERLLTLQKNLIREVRPHVSMKDLNEKMKEGLTEILLEQSLLQGTFKEHLKKNSFFKYCPHSLGHLLGLDVHDPGFFSMEEAILEENMVLTIEPGIYISKKNRNAPKDLRGLGLRIEDDILVTSKGQENLTKGIPKEIQEIEELCSQKFS